ncbi:MAG: fumarate hydratase, partial [Actinomycetia bacterium]|nr:fumarate hydratase [Actinomycetes bacterium]
MADFKYTDLLPLAEDTTPYRLLTTDGVEEIDLGGRRFLQVSDEAIRLLTATAIRDISHLLRPGHLQQLADILDDPEASANDRFVAAALLQNAHIAPGFVLPGCQYTGTVLVKGKKGQYVLTDGDDKEAIARGTCFTYQTSNLR